MIENEEKKSSNNFWAAKATAIHQIPNDVKKGVIATPILSKTIKVAKTQTTICIIVLSISLKFFFVLASCPLNPFSIIKFNKYLTNADTSIQTATINKTAKTTRTVSLNGNHNEAIKREKTIQEYQEILAKIWKKDLSLCHFFSTFLAKNPEIHFTKKRTNRHHKNTQAEIPKALLLITAPSLNRKEKYSIRYSLLNKTFFV